MKTINLAVTFDEDLPFSLRLYLYKVLDPSPFIIQNEDKTEVVGMRIWKHRLYTVSLV